MLEVVKLFCDIAVAMGALYAARAAMGALKTWRAQLQGTAEYEMARRLLRSAYRYRGAVAHVRARNFTIGELAAETLPEDFVPANSAEENLIRTVAVYWRRWGRVTAARLEIDANAVEAEVLWGGTVRGRFKPLLTLEMELLSQLQARVDSLDPRNTAEQREAQRKALAARGRQAINGFFFDMRDTRDTFGVDFIGEIDKIEAWLQSHLRPQHAEG